MSETDILAARRQTVREFLVRRLRTEIGDNEDFFKAGYINSLFAMELVTFLEKSFGIEIPNSDLRIENFNTVEAITALVSRCLAK